MSWLPVGTTLGELTLIESYVDYDGPRVFSCISSTDQMYLAVWVAEDLEYDDWIYVPISAARLAMVRSGGIELRDAFRDPEGGAVYVVTLPLDGPDSVASMHGSDLQPELLPASGFRLDVPTHTVPDADPRDLWHRRTIQERRPRVRIEVEIPRYFRTEAPTRQVGSLLLATQNLFDNVGMALLTGDPAQRGRIRGEITQQTATDVVGLAAASFVVEIASSNLDNLFDGSAFTEVTQRVLGLLDTTLEREALVESLRVLRPRAAKSFRNFVGTLATFDGDVTIAGAGAALGYAEQRLPSERIETLKILLNILLPDDVYVIRGRMRLFLGDTQRERFGLQEIHTGQQFEGAIAPAATGQVHLAALDALFDVVITEFGAIDEAVGERNPTYVLEQLIPVEDDDDPAPAITRVAQGIFTEGTDEDPPF